MVLAPDKSTWQVRATAVSQILKEESTMPANPEADISEEHDLRPNASFMLCNDAPKVCRAEVINLETFRCICSGYSP
jgi:hypothetical protein